MAARKPFPLRVREDLFEAISQWAQDDMRSVNGQIEYILRDALWRAGRLKKPDPPEPIVEQSDDD